MKGSGGIQVVFVLALVATGFTLIIIEDDVSGLFAGGDGSVSDPFLISNLTHLQNMDLGLGYHYKLINDIDASATRQMNGGSGFDPVGLSFTSMFEGSLKGQGFNITGLFMNRSDGDYVGLFSFLSGTVTDVNLVDYNISGNNYVGGLAGWNEDGHITDSAAQGTIHGNDAVGGMVGWNRLGRLKDCQSECLIYGNSNLGGLVGFNEGTVSNSFYCVNDSKINDREYFTPYGILDYQFEDWIVNEKVLDIDDYLEEDPGTGRYSISNVSDLKKMMPFAASTDHDFILAGDIDLRQNGDVYIPVLKSGSLDGSGRSISNLDIGSLNNSRMGLIGYLGEDASLSGLNLENPDVEGDDYVGTLVGFNDGTITYCRTNGGAYGEQFVGSLVGCNNRGTISDSYSRHGSVQGGLYVGGISGCNDNIITRCYSSAGVSQGSYSGGLVGDNYYDGIISNCYAMGKVKGDKYVGGLVGRNYQSTISNCYSAGVVEGNESAGGLIGFNNQGSVSGCFWDKERSIDTSNGGYGRTTKEMLNISTYKGALWNFNSIWNIAEGESYPFLRSIDYGIPEIITEDVKIAVEDAEYKVDYTALSDLPGNGSIWSLHTDAKWLSLSECGVISGIPENDDVGFCWVNVTASAGTHFSYTNFTLEVLNSNDEPSIDTLSIPDATEDEFYSAAIRGSDIDPTGDVLKWSLKFNPGFLAIDTETGDLSGTPSNDDVGSRRVVVNVSDGKGGYDEVNFTLEVLNVNDDPVILPFEIDEVLEDEEFGIDMDAADEDPTDDVLVWSVSTKASFLQIDPDSGRIWGTPENNDVGVWEVNVSVEDGRGGLDFTVFELEVLNVNDGPEALMEEMTIVIDEDSDDGEIDLTGIFSDDDGDDLSFEFENVQNLTLNLGDGYLFVIPKSDWSGEVTVPVSASDGLLSASIDIIIKVNPVNDPPKDLGIIADPTYIEGEDQIVNSSAVDSDLPYGDELTFRWSSNITGEIGEGRSVNLSLPEGLHLVTLNVTDSEGASAETSVEVLIEPNERTGEEEDNDSRIPIIFIIMIILLGLTGMIIGLSLLKSKREKKTTNKNDLQNQMVEDFDQSA